MGVYYFPANIDKREYVHAHRLGVGLKKREMLSSGEKGVPHAVLYLLFGRWSGDRITVYNDDSALPWENGLAENEDECGNRWTDVSYLAKDGLDEVLG